MVNFGEWIRSEIRRRGLTEEECQVRSGLTQPNWSRLINSPPQQPRKRTMEAVALALDIPLGIVMAAAGYAMENESSGQRIALLIEPYLLRVPPAKRQAAERSMVNHAREISELLTA